MALRLNASFLALAFLFAACLAMLAQTTQAHAVTCHSSYTVYGHYVPTHMVKATAKHSSYMIYRHYVKSHVVKANCKKV